MQNTATDAAAAQALRAPDHIDTLILDLRFALDRRHTHLAGEACASGSHHSLLHRAQRAETACHQHKIQNLHLCAVLQQIAEACEAAAAEAPSLPMLARMARAALSEDGSQSRSTIPPPG